MEKKILFLIIFSLTSKGFAGNWCVMSEGFAVTTHGTHSETVWVNGEFEGRSENLWIPIAKPGLYEANITIALAAQMASESLVLYIEEADGSCGSIPDWDATVRHVRIGN